MQDASSVVDSKSFQRNADRGDGVHTDMDRNAGLDMKSEIDAASGTNDSEDRNSLQDPSGLPSNHANQMSIKGKVTLDVGSSMDNEVTKGAIGDGAEQSDEVGGFKASTNSWHVDENAPHNKISVANVFKPVEGTENIEGNGIGSKTFASSDRGLDTEGAGGEAGANPSEVKGNIVSNNERWNEVAPDVQASAQSEDTRIQDADLKAVAVKSSDDDEIVVTKAGERIDQPDRNSESDAVGDKVDEKDESKDIVADGSSKPISSSENNRQETESVSDGANSGSEGKDVEVQGDDIDGENRKAVAALDDGDVGVGNSGSETKVDDAGSSGSDTKIDSEGSEVTPRNSETNSDSTAQSISNVGGSRLDDDAQLSSSKETRGEDKLGDISIGNLDSGDVPKNLAGSKESAEDDGNVQTAVQARTDGDGEGDGVDAGHVAGQVKLCRQSTSFV